jgi:hypothetical protein
MQTMDEVFLQINKFPLTAKVPIVTSGKKSKIRNELPLISQSLANSIATVAWGLASPRGQANIQKSIEISVKRKFLPYINAMAKGNKKSLSHVYEWNKVGVTSARLFDLTIPSTSRGKTNFSMKVDFRPSKTLVPLTEAQATPNPQTGAVVKRRHIFYNKAMVMEYGQSVTVRPKTSKYMAFDNPPGTVPTLSGLTFSSRPVTINYASMPTYHGLQAAITSFFKTVGEKDSADAVKNYSRQVRKGAEKASHMISVSVPSDEYAHSVASKITNAMMPSG